MAREEGTILKTIASCALLMLAIALAVIYYSVMGRQGLLIGIAIVVIALWGFTDFFGALVRVVKRLQRKLKRAG
ncbi:MAG: hypothetical protein FJ118_02465 [Deltaproteobacteria bacterium]|nr:hypothetical protein [Deltaproteobacteria bacterium]